MNTVDVISDLNRREFIKSSSFASAMFLLGAVPIQAAERTEPEPQSGPPVNIGIIGCGFWAREIMDKLAKLANKDINAHPVNAPIVALCDHYEAFLNRAKTQLAPNAEAYDDYKKLLADKNVKAVIVATPSHLHKQIVLDALAAGKHVYCEAPIATTIEDSRAIAQAAQKAFKQYFQPGLLFRSDPQMLFLLPFVRSGGIGQSIKARSQWHKNLSWRKPSPNPEREAELNWRLDKKISIGLVGEIGVQQLDVASWFYRANPVAVTGFGSVVKWKDEGRREVPDSIQAVFEYPERVLFNYEATLANSFDGMLDVYLGTDATLMIRDGRAWMFKEPDAPMNGWEVYATKNSFYKETGISVLSGASKLDKQIVNATDPRPDDQGSLYYALGAFVRNTNLVSRAVENFIADFGADDVEGMKKAIEDERKFAAPAAGAKEGHEAAVAVIKANEAVIKRERIVLAKEWFSL